MASVSTSHEEESSISGTRAMSGSPANRRRKCVIASRASIIGASMHTSMIWAPSSTCLRTISTASSHFSSRTRRAKRALPATFARSPTLTKLASGSMTSGSNPAKTVLWSASGTRRGEYFPAISDKREMYSGVVPQQPPTMFTKPSCKYFSTQAAICPIVWAYPPNPSGSPALGWHETGRAAVRERRSRKGSICSAPKAQLSPMENRPIRANEA